jgi:indole-3-glycerol phosphate synthase/phosphoribosylanthranilate isomerase
MREDLVDTTENIRDGIIAKRRVRIAAEGHTLGIAVPDARRVPVIPFGEAPIFLCEVKRRSPSRGAIALGLDATAQAGLYADAGATAVSVLTEEEFFGGTLADLMAVKERFPHLTVLRKDFLIDPEDIDVSYRAGADAVLLIAGALDEDRLASLYRRARHLAMDVLVEIHDLEEIRKCERIHPPVVGINSRDLKTFTVDRTIPPAVRAAIPWESRVIFESGIGCSEDALFAGYTGFAGILVGESVVRDPAVAPELKSGLMRGIELRRKRESDHGFWDSLYFRRLKRVQCDPRQFKHRPLVKICGITNETDARVASEFGADILGFVFAESPRRADPDFVTRLQLPHTDRNGGRYPVLRVGVVVGNREAGGIPAEVFELLARGALDAIQFHGDEAPEACAVTAYPYFKALRLRHPADTAAIPAYHCPRVLIDAWSKETRGGTGKTLDSDLLAGASEVGPLWLAGGLAPDNVGDLIRRWRPELIDASSRLESAPGRKDHTLLQEFFRKIDAAARSIYDEDT